uniref:PH domain-containing protein n=1 Tax=Eptatretus burgeri TaxID=7764 RepID=A0A8C4NDP5_EPTBU
MAVGCVRAACAAFWGACCPLGQPRPRAPSQQELLEVPASPGATGSQAAVVSPLDTPSVLIASPHGRSSRWCGGHGPSLCSWLHIGHKAKAETRIDEQEFLMKGWLYRECHSTVEAASMLRLRLRRRWFVLTPHGLDYYREPAGASGKGRRLGGLVLTQLCTAEGPDEESQEAAGLWKVTLCGRRLCMRLFTRSHPEALTWHHALRSAIAALPPTLSPTQMLISDIQVPGFCEAFGDVQVTKGQQSLKRNHLLVNFIENVTFLGLCASPTEFANPSSAGMWRGSGGPRMCVPAEPCTHMYDDATACTAPSTTPYKLLRPPCETTIISYINNISPCQTVYCMAHLLKSQTVLCLTSLCMFI